jgi:two-component system sensor kinase FixL
MVLRAVPSAALEVEITVTDQGLGFSTEKLAKLFEAFITTEEDGMGIGLMICQTIIEAHGGQFTAENNPERDATERFTLPKSHYEEEKSA